LKGVDLFNVNNSSIHIDDFKTLHIDHQSRFPFVNQIINTMADNTDYNLIIFVNSDIIVQPCLLDHITGDYETIMASRMDVEPCDGGYKPVEYSVHGFDLFGVRTEWWRLNKHRFPDMYLGRPYWDTLYYVLCMMHSKCRTVNTHPVCIYHVKHANEWDNIVDEFKTHNERQVQTTPGFENWWRYVYDVLLKRPDRDGVKYWTPLNNEQQIANSLFKV
jgi:hypothetical protein